MNPLIPLWIIGGPFIGLLILAFSFKGPSAMGGTAPRLAPRASNGYPDPAAPLLDPMHPKAPRRFI
jgi:hypothetical protein